MSADVIDLVRFGERLAWVRRTYGESIDLPDLGRAAFAKLLGVSVFEYESYECGGAQPTVTFLVGLRKKTGVSLDWFLDLSYRGRSRPFR